MFPLFGEIPPEIKAQLEQQADKQRMHTQANIHDIKQLLDSLDKDQLSTLEMIVHSAMHSPETGAIMLGRIEMVQQMKFDKCPCGEEHDASADLLGGAAPAESHAPEPLSDTVTEIEPTQVIDDVKALRPNTPEFNKACEDYGVEPILGTLGKVKCKGCGYESVSLDDRMRRRPGIDGCQGCQQKAAWG